MPFRIAIDFDGTIADFDWPDIGPEVPHAFWWMREFQMAGAELLLWTCRTSREGERAWLEEAVRFCLCRGIEFLGVNTDTNCPDRPKFQGGVKINADVYIDERNAGCPVIPSRSREGKSILDWEAVGPGVMLQLQEFNASQGKVPRKLSPRHDPCKVYEELLIRWWKAWAKPHWVEGESQEEVESELFKVAEALDMQRRMEGRP
jgi:hypothetical protein